jgi:hypothetical protein
MRATDIRTCVLSGKRPPLPASLHPDISHVIQQCWAQDAAARPAFVTVLALLNSVLQATREGGTTTTETATATLTLA